MPITDRAIYNKEWNKKVIKNGIIKKRLQEFKQYRKTEDYTEKALKIKAFSEAVLHTANMELMVGIEPTTC